MTGAIDESVCCPVSEQIKKVRRIESKKHIVRKILHFFKVRMKIDFSRSVYTEILLYAFLLKDISDIESCYVLWFPLKK